MQEAGVSQDVFDAWKVEVNKCFRRRNFTSLPCADNDAGEGNVDARSLTTQIGTNNKITSELTKAVTDLGEEVRLLKRQNTKQLEEMKSISVKLAECNARNELLLKQNVQIIQQTQLLMGGGLQQLAAGGQISSTPTTLNHNPPPICGTPVVSPQVVSPAGQRVSEPDCTEYGFEQIRQEICNDQSPISKFTNAFKNDIFGLYKSHLASDEWKNTLPPERKKISRSMNNVQKFVLKAIHFYDRTNDQSMFLKTLLFVKKDFTKEKRSEWVRQVRVVAKTCVENARAAIDPGKDISASSIRDYKVNEYNDWKKKFK